MKAFYGDLRLGILGGGQLGRSAGNGIQLMAKDNGYALLRHVRNELALSAEVLPAVAITSFVRVEDRDAALEAGRAGGVPLPK